MKDRISFHIPLITAAILFICSSSFSQSNGYKDRLSGVRDLINSNELIMIWNQGVNQSSHNSYMRIFDLNLIHPGGVDSTLVKKPINIDSAAAGNKKVAVATGNFLGGSFKHFVAAWEGPGNTVTVMVPEIDAGILDWSEANRISIPGLATTGKRKIHLETGDFFGNAQDEFIAAFQGTDASIHLKLCSFNPGSLIPQQRGSINDEVIVSDASLANFDIVAGDFNGDGYDDVALLYVKPTTGSNWSLFIKIYTIDQNGNFIPGASAEVFQNPQYNVTEINVKGAAGLFDADASEEIAFGFSFFQGEEPGNDTYVYLIDVRNNLSSIIIDDTKRAARNVVGPNDMPQFDVAAGDLNKDHRDEFVMMSGQTFYVYTTDDQLIPSFKSQRSVLSEGENEQSDSFLAIEDMDLNLSSEIVVAKSFADFSVNGLQHFEMHVFSLDTTLVNYTVKSRRLNEEPVTTNSGLRNYAIALGDFDGDRTRLGDPVHYRRTGVMQPTVILYTPPVHYDIFEGTGYDLCGCFPDQSCGFTSTYIQSTTVDTTITTEIHEDWGGDATVTGSYGVLKAKVSATYGDKFSNKESSGTSYTITTGRIASGDDWIYANVFDLDFYEYPVYDSLNPAPIGYFLVTIPTQPRPLWIELKDDDLLGNQFRPDHETGNILSYRTANTFDTARVIVDFPEQTIGSTGNSFVSLQIESFQENSVETSWDAGLEIGATIDLTTEIFGFEAGLEVEVNGHYNYGEIYTQTVKVQQSMEVRGDLGHLQPQFGTGGTYYVKPYAYWTSYGALALDYKISPLPAGGNSFWQERYGNKNDLAFSLPWRYDPEKGYPFPGNDSSYRYRSRDIFLSKVQPVGGDSVFIIAKIRNFGLQAVSSSFNVRFYIGDPDAGGTEIGAASVDTTIGARGYKNVSVPWYIPLNMYLDTVRIYAVIDPENTITNEVHENNNKGWTPAIGLGSIVTGVEAEQIIPDEFVLYQSYPNPFNPVTTISYDIPYAGEVSLKVYNVLGQEVAALVNEYRNSGSYKVHFDGSNLASGIYLYQLKISDFTDVKKMVLMK